MITIQCVTDDKPGHRNQLLGLSQALQEKLPAQVQWQSLNEASPSSSSQPDLILAAGHRTHWPALKLKWCTGAKLVVLMKPSLPRFFFDLCIAPRHDGLQEGPRVCVTEGAINPITVSTSSEPNRGLILIGGPSRHYDWDDGDLVSQLQQLRQRFPQVNWTLSTSRRTPTTFLDAAASLAGDQLKLVPVEETDSRWLQHRYQSCGKIWVTEDSVSMVYESLSTGAEVGVLTVPRLSDNRISQGLDKLKQEHRVATLNDLNHSSAQQQRQAIEPLQEASKAAERIIAQFFPNDIPRRSSL